MDGSTTPEVIQQSPPAPVHPLQKENVVAERPFSVEARKPETWFNTFKQTQDGQLPKKEFSVGKVELNDAIAKDINSVVSILKSGKEGGVSFILGADLDYSEKFLKETGGYNSTGVAVKTANALREKGVKIKFDVNSDRQQILFLEKDGLHFKVNLGWAHENEKPQTEGEPDLYYPESGLLAKVEDSNSPSKKTNTNETVFFELVDSSSGKFILNLSDSDTLAHHVTGFAEMLGEFMNAYYQAHGLVGPKTNMALRIPDWETYQSDGKSYATRHKKSLKEAMQDVSLFNLFPLPGNEIGSLLTEEEKASMPSFTEIGGQPRAVDEAKKLVMSIKNAEVFDKRGVDRPKGILLKGPPGTGKTMLAKAIAKEAGVEFMSLSITDLVSKWFGEAEQKVQGFFDRARVLTDQGKDVIVFMDEIDSIVPQREGTHEATQKMVSIFLQNLDGMKSNPRLTVLAATNHPENVDPAFLRPGRLDKIIDVELPDVGGRAQILSVHLQKHLKRAADPTSFIDPQISLTEVANAFGNVSGADIASIVNLALEEKTTAEIRQIEGIEGGASWSPLTAHDLLQAKEKYIRTSKEKHPIGFVPSSQAA
ncbi:ATP-binding protein [Candidatus Roizmanbacteria bacterium]|nr:ATP-binding protein [Candidatus Roizmanbacteria bacterium]